MQGGALAVIETSGFIPETRNSETPCDKVIYKVLYNDMSI